MSVPACILAIDPGFDLLEELCPIVCNDDRSVEPSAGADCSHDVRVVDVLSMLLRVRLRQIRSPNGASPGTC